jgi:hypothetical protein
MSETGIFYKGIGINRDFMSIVRQYFDIYSTGEGFGWNYVWQRTDNRFPIIHPFLDGIKRRGRADKSTSELMKLHPGNLFLKFDEVQGIVSDAIHKEFHLITGAEEIKIHFRKYEEFEGFNNFLKNKIADKVHARDDTEIKASVYIENKN